MRFGAWQICHYPGCGCDACAEDVAGVCEEFHRELRSVIGGRFQEWVDQGRFHHTFGESSGWYLLEAHSTPPGLSPHYRSDWTPWIGLRQW
ncbi:MAG: hypothetical protein H0U92_11035 [Actinobacteria bacterium]|nr:hypothetical protein [Actinomycetota bacterium]